MFVSEGMNCNCLEWMQNKTIAPSTTSNWGLDCNIFILHFLSSMIALSHYGHVINHIHSANPLLLRVCVGVCVSVCVCESESEW